MRVIEDILLSERDGGDKQGQWPCVVCLEKRARAGSRNGIQENPGFNKNIKKSGPLIMGEGGSRLVLYINYILA